MAPLLQLKGITKEYRGNAAVKNIDFDLLEGEIHAIVGENGAGKSTLTKIMAGVVEPTSGTMFLAGAPVRFASPAQAMARGVAMVFQETSLVPTMSVAQNLYLGEEKLFNRLRGQLPATRDEVRIAFHACGHLPGYGWHETLQRGAIRPPRSDHAL